MLKLTRRCGEEVVINDNIIVKVLEMDDRQVRLGFSAPDTVSIHRREIQLKIKKEAQDTLLRGVLTVNQFNQLH